MAEYKRIWIITYTTKSGMLQQERFCTEEEADEFEKWLDYRQAFEDEKIDWITCSFYAKY